MDYEKKYKEANDKVAVRFGTNVAKEIFTDLYESEDERIRKSLLRWMQSNSYTSIAGMPIKNVIAWLEKQGEQKVSYTTLVETGNGGINALVTKELPTNSCNEQKPDDKVEPKFHEGEWVVQEKIGVYKVIEVCESWYEVVDNKDKHYSIGFDKEYMCHLWTIQDAKDGDVLVFDDIIMIFRNIQTVCTANTYILYCDKIFIDDWCDFGVDAQPATKEQQDLLFSKMKEAGYKWDADKKELSKCVIDEGKSEMDYCFTKMMNGEKVSPTWSEEDENMLKSIIATCELAEQDRDSSPARHLFEMQTNWLKSLKERIGG